MKQESELHSLLMMEIISALSASSAEVDWIYHAPKLVLAVERGNLLFSFSSADFCKCIHWNEFCTICETQNVIHDVNMVNILINVNIHTSLHHMLKIEIKFDKCAYCGWFNKWIHLEISSLYECWKIWRWTPVLQWFGSGTSSRTTVVIQRRILTCSTLCAARMSNCRRSLWDRTRKVISSRKRFCFGNHFIV